MATIEDLERRIVELEEKLAKREAQQITFPLDRESIEILNKYFVSIIDEYVYFGGVGDNSFPVYVGFQDGKRFDVAPSNIRYSVDPSTDFVTIVDRTPYTRFSDDAQVILFTTDTAPTGLSAQGLTTYHVVSADATGYKFKLSATQGGSAINITAVGAGRQYLNRI